MKFLENELLNIKEMKKDILYIFGDHKRTWLCFFDGLDYFSFDKNKNKKSKLQKEQINLLIETEFSTSDIELAYNKYDEIYFKNLKESIINKRVVYTCAKLTKESHFLLVKKMNEIIPEDWDIIAHHMTLCLGELPESKKEILGSYVTLKAVSYAIDYDKKVMAVKIESSLETNSVYKHITIALGDGAKAVLSNELNKFYNMEPILLDARVFSITNENKDF